MIASTVLVYLLLAVSSADSQETVNVIVLQSNGDQCPPADQLGAVRSNVIEKIRTLNLSKPINFTISWIISKSSNLMCEPSSA